MDRVHSTGSAQSCCYRRAPEPAPACSTHRNLSQALPVSARNPRADSRRRIRWMTTTTARRCRAVGAVDGCDLDRLDNHAAQSWLRPAPRSALVCSGWRAGSGAVSADRPSCSAQLVRQVCLRCLGRSFRPDRSTAAQPARGRLGSKPAPGRGWRSPVRSARSLPGQCRLAAVPRGRGAGGQPPLPDPDPATGGGSMAAVRPRAVDPGVVWPEPMHGPGLRRLSPIA